MPIDESKSGRNQVILLLFVRHVQKKTCSWKKWGITSRQFGRLSWVAFLGVLRETASVSRRRFFNSKFGAASAVLVPFAERRNDHRLLQRWPFMLASVSIVRIGQRAFPELQRNRYSGPQTSGTAGYSRVAPSPSAPSGSNTEIAAAVPATVARAQSTVVRLTRTASEIVGRAARSASSAMLRTGRNG